MELSEKDQVRLLISDVGGQDEESFIFSDEEINAFLSMEGGNIKLAASTALRTIAANTAMVMKVIKFMELSTDGAKVAKVLLETAKELKEQGEEDDEEIDIISMNLNSTSESELIANRLRGLG